MSTPHFHSWFVSDLAFMPSQKDNLFLGRCECGNIRQESGSTWAYFFAVQTRQESREKADARWQAGEPVL